MYTQTSRSNADAVIMLTRVACERLSLSQNSRVYTPLMTEMVNSKRTVLHPFTYGIITLGDLTLRQFTSLCDVGLHGAKYQ